MKNDIVSNIDLELKKNIVDALEDSVDFYREFKAQSPFNATHNCYGAARWDSINEVLSSVFQKNDVPYALSKKGCWGMLLFCNKERDFIFSVMRKERFENICKNPEQNAPQYFDSLVSLNNDLEARLSQTTLIDDVYQATDKYNQLDSLCKCLPKSKNSKFNHAILLFEVEYDDIVSIKICIVNNKFEIVYEEDIMKTVFNSRIPDTVSTVTKSNFDDKTSTKKGFVSLKDSAFEAK